MDVAVVLEHRFAGTPDGAVWTQVAFAYSFWTRYLEVFDGVRIVARVGGDIDVTKGWKRVDGPGVAVASVPFYLGPRQFFARAPQVRRAVRNAVGKDDAVILRVSSQLANLVAPKLRRTGRPYGVEVVGDPYEVFAPGVVSHPLRPFFRWWFSTRLARQCAWASAAAYVTNKVLQRRYPCPAFMVGVSDVEISDRALVPTPRIVDRERQSFTLISVGSLAQLYKAPDVLIDAVAYCVRDGIDVRLVWVGDGRYRPELEARAAASGLAGRVCFLGELPAGDAVRKQMDQADLFVLASRTEGLPRALIEAMARALPCIGTSVGGIPELLASDEMVLAGDATLLSSKIREILSDPHRMACMSAHNLERAQAYREETLRDRRLSFYRRVRDETEAWLKEQSR